MTAPMASAVTQSVWASCERCGRPAAIEFRDHGNVAPSDVYLVMLGVHVSWCGFCHAEAARAAPAQ